MVNKKINLENKMIEDIGLSKLNIYNDSMKLSNKIWDIVNVLDYFVKDTIGKQLVRSADSISANISEGYGRYSFKENI
jgi:four helix bundle protein